MRAVDLRLSQGRWCGSVADWRRRCVTRFGLRHGYPHSGAARAGTGS
ncbi:MAG: hypothetical protein KC430_09435 [Amylibacter sp.]|nr:hypothetical protein [Amylibacter sp.]